LLLRICLATIEKINSKGAVQNHAADLVAFQELCPCGSCTSQVLIFPEQHCHAESNLDDRFYQGSWNI